MKIMIPADVPEDEDDCYTQVWVAGYRAERGLEPLSEHDRASWPSAWDAGQVAAVQEQMGQAR